MIINNWFILKKVLIKHESSNGKIVVVIVVISICTTKYNWGRLPHLNNKRYNSSIKRSDFYA